MISRTRGYLPHLEISDGTYFVTFRLSDSLPTGVLVNLKQERFLKKTARIPTSVALPKNDYDDKIEVLLGKGIGECYLKDPDIARLVVDALRRFDNLQYSLHAWTVMPNHVHVLFTVHDSSNVSLIIQGWKGSTAFQANRLLRRTGRFWQPEYFDRLIKTTRQFEFYLRYIFKNPIRAGLCLEVFEWPWSGCSVDLHYFVDRVFRCRLKPAAPNAD